MRHLCISLLILCSTATCTLAEPAKTPCGQSTYKLPLDYIAMGMTTAAAKSAVKVKFPTAEVVEDAQKIIFIMPKGQDGMFDSFAVGLTGKTVTRLILSYSSAFQSPFGSSSDALLALVKRLADKYGRSASVDEKGDGYIVTWSENGGMDMHVSGGSRDSLMLVFTCNDLVTDLKEEATKGVNFGI
jgi:hypothetical protein